MAYVVFTSVLASLHLSGVAVQGNPYFRNWIDILWVGFGYVSIIKILRSGKLRLSLGLTLCFAIVTIGPLALIIGHQFSVSPTELAMLPTIMDLKPFFYASIAYLWIAAFGTPRATDFVRYGTYLSGILFVNFVIESMLEGRMVRPFGSGDVNYDACLLIISFCAALISATPNRLRTAIIFLGICLSLSRTGLVTTVFIALFFARFPLKTKFFLVAACAGLIVVSYQIRDLPLFDLAHLDRYWMWLAAISMIAEHPLQALIGFPTGVSLPVDIPVAAEWLWSFQQKTAGIDGIFPYNFHSFWLRLYLTLGLTAGIFLSVLVYIFLRRRNSIWLRSLALVIILQGMTMGLFYLSNIAIPLLLALGASAKKPPAPRAVSRPRSKIRNPRVDIHPDSHPK